MLRVCMMFISHQSGASMVSIMTKKSKQVDGGRFSLRLPNEMLESIDKECAKRIGCVSRNTWIAEAIAEKLSRANSEHSPIPDDIKAA